MKKLTVRMIKESRMTGIDVIKHFRPELSDEEAYDLLWEATSFPFSTPSDLIKELNETFKDKITK